jgi:hypothetical protein
MKTKRFPVAPRRRPFWVVPLLGLGVLVVASVVFETRRKPLGAPVAPRAPADAAPVPAIPIMPQEEAPFAAPAAGAKQEFTPGPQPPGPVPEGKVWSEEHGHWHNVLATPASGDARAPVAQPPGPAPEGKVWSEEHGHWHNVPGAETVTISPSTPSTGSTDALKPPAESEADAPPPDSVEPEADKSEAMESEAADPVASPDP